MFEKPEDVRMTREEMEEYGRKINAKNVALEHVEVLEEAPALAANQVPPPMTEEEVKKRVGEQNYANVQKGTTMSSINS
ncbi:hypothetical protein [Sporosarcina sp. YIM B06819]|uniref:hypothetical protein n=1 Tax=Sporosarcina sp. YIM B06819 TaxID=3081769 RepID=UPI00298D2FAB|nr:hypothetical protein [Sporosarcina sp. YIM B06819]